MAYPRRYFAAAARLWGEAFAADPTLRADRDAQRLCHAAHAAILAADGKGKDEPPPDDQSRSRLRAQAADWLKAALATWSKALESGSDPDRVRLTRAVQRWKNETDLAGVRDPDALAKLPAPEQQAWRSFWSDVDALLRKATGGRPGQ
jgi:serine/threonine-protein kinase